MVGTMVPVYQAAAQEVSVEQRAAMLAQISQLMELITQLMAQLQMMQADEVVTDVSTEKKELKKPATDQASVCPYTWTRSLNIYSIGNDVKQLQRFLNLDPRTQVATRGVGSPGQESTVFDENTAEAVNKFSVLYRAEILSPQGLVNPSGIFGSAATAKANSMCAKRSSDVTPFVGIKDFDADVTKENDTHSPYVEFEWEAVGVSSCSVFINGTPILTNRTGVGDNKDSRHEIARTSLREKWGTDYIDGRNKFELRCQSKYTEKDSTVSEYDTVVIDLEDEVMTDADGEVDSEDNDLLREQVDHLLEVIEDPKNVPAKSKRNQMSELKLQALLNNLMSQLDQQLEDENNDVGMSRDFWDVDKNDAVLVVGAYQGSYPDGAKRGFQQHPQGEVTVNLTKRAGWQEDTMLILTSYEPVKWVLTGDAVNDAVSRVFLSGYYDQEVVGISSDVEVIHYSHESGDRDYYYAYEQNSKNYNQLQNFFKGQTGREFYNFTGEYSLDTVSLGLKGQVK